MTPRSPLVGDERGNDTFRVRAGALLTRATTADFAVMRIRLAALDLTGSETRGVRRCRVLLGHLDAGTLLDTCEGVDAGAADRLGVLLSFIDSGRLEIRSAGLGTWAPDFSVFDVGSDGAALLGAHQFGPPYPNAGPSFTAHIDEAASVGLMAKRFEEIWELGHDVLPAIRNVVSRAHEVALEAAGRGGVADRTTALR